MTRVLALLPRSTMPIPEDADLITEIDDDDDEYDLTDDYPDGAMDDDDSDEIEHIADTPEPPPIPVYDPTTNQPMTPAEERDRVNKAIRKPVDFKARGAKISATRRANEAKKRAADPDLVAIDTETEEQTALREKKKEKRDDAEVQAAIADTNFESDSDLRAFFRRTRVKRYEALMKIATKGKSEAIRLNAIKLLDYRDLGRPSSAPPPDDETEPSTIAI